MTTTLPATALFPHPVRQKIRRLLEEGRIDEVTPIWQQHGGASTEEKHQNIKVLWKMATLKSLPQVSKQWLTQQQPLIECLPKFDEREGGHVILCKWRDYFRNLAQYNFDLLIELSQHQGFDHHWYALQGAIQVNNNVSDPKQQQQLWNQLYNGYRQKRQKPMHMLVLLHQALVAGNAAAVAWVMKTNHRVELASQIETVGLKWAEVDDTGFLIGGLDRLGGNYATIQTEQLARTLARIPQQMLNWQEIERATYLELSDKLYQARIILTKAELDKAIEPAHKNNPSQRL